jgi:3-deoxy-D-manno-octulosonate 8-phosphate phosphatase (KDO 8-P phosphatase)
LEARFNGLGITDIYLKAGMKLQIYTDWMQRNGLSIENVAYVGDDLPDRECMEITPLSVAPADSSPDILSIARYISPCNGGYGVARDLLEEILRAQNKWPKTDKACGW